jgi:hypothetical protein
VPERHLNLLSLPPPAVSSGLQELWVVLSWEFSLSEISPGKTRLIAFSFYRVQLQKPVPDLKKKYLRSGVKAREKP